MIPDWLMALAEQGTPREVAGNSPLWLDDPDSVWLIRAGWIDVFSVSSLPGDLPGARHHLYRATIGGLLCGIASSLSTISEGQDRPRLLAVGGPDSEIVHLRREQLATLGRREWAALLDGWIRGLTDGVARRRPTGKVASLEPGERRLEAGQMASPGHPLVWVRHLDGGSRFLGMAELPLRKEDGFVPFCGAAWLTADEAEARLEVVTAETFLGDLQWVCLDHFHQMILACASLNLVEANQQEHARLKLRAEGDERLMRTTLSRLVRATTHATEEEEQDAEENALLAACRLVGGRIGVEMRSPRLVGESLKQNDPVTAIARASRVRVRRVLLKGEWWRQENGPLLAYRAADEQPVALLPTSGTGYDMVDPVTRTPARVTVANASALLPFAYSFYRPFAAQALTAWQLFRFSMKGNQRDWAVVILLGLAASLLGMFTPIVTGWIFDWIIPAADRGQLLLVILGLTVSAVSVALFQLTRGIAVLRLETKMESGVQAALWDRLLDLPAPFFRRFTAGDLADRSLGIMVIRQILTDVALSAALSLMFSLVSFGLLFYYDVRLALLAGGIFVTVVLITALAAFAQWRYQRRLSEVRGRIAGFVLQLITGISRLRVAGAETRALAVWAREFSVQCRLAFRARCVANNLAAFNAAAPIVAVMALFAAVSLQAREELSLGSFLAFNVAFFQVLSAALVVSSLIGYAAEVVPLQERARPILETPPEVDLAKAHPGDLSGDIEIGHVSFRYHLDGPLILDDVSVHIGAGEFVAFVGPSGAGKSTIIRLLLGFEAPTSGSIYYDRLDLTGLDLQAVRRQMGVVLQDGKIMAGDILTNISGSGRLTQEEAWEAASASGFDEDVRQMPMGMFTVLSEGGSTLSGGQRQRLMIARAVVSKPLVLLFDEATSALDNETQAKVSGSLERLKATRVVVAHRLSTVVRADRIYVLDKGRVIQSGTYDELMQQEGLFAELARRQLA
jgi:NHLM bacteriocin system ABC transporter ATP-binding protein